MSSSHFNYWQTIILSNIQTLLLLHTHLCQCSTPLSLILQSLPPTLLWLVAKNTSTLSCVSVHTLSPILLLPLSLSSSHFCLTHSTLVRPSVSLSFPPPCGGLYTLHISPTTLLPLTMTSSSCCVQSAWWVASCVQQVFSCNFCQENCFTD